MERKILTMEKLRAKLKKNSGFTLIEMLIVVAIIAILIMVSIPMITNALNSAKEATDSANERSAMAAALIEYMTNKDLFKDAATTERTVYYVVNDTQGKINSTATTAPTSDFDYGQCKEHAGKGITLKITKDGVITLVWDGSSAEKNHVYKTTTTPPPSGG